MVMIPPWGLGAPWGNFIGAYIQDLEDRLSALEQAVTIENGFIDRDESTLSFSNATRTLTVTPVGGDYSYVAGGTRYTKTAADSVVIPDTEGLHGVYYDGATLKTQLGITVELIRDHALVAAIYWDATNDEALHLGDERHSNVMDSATHIYNHLTMGTRYQEGLLLGDMTVDGTGNSDADAQLSVDDGVIWDEDIQFNITDGSPQTLDPIAQIPVLYRTGATGVWRRYTPTNFPIATAGTGRAAWNEWTGSTWQVTEVTNNDFVLSHLIAVNSFEYPIFAIMGQNRYITKAAARAGATTELYNLSLGPISYLSPELLAIGTVIFESKDSYTNTVKSRVVSTDEGDDYVNWLEGRIID